MTKKIIIIFILVISSALIYAHWPGESLAQNIYTDKIVVEKSKRELTLFKNKLPLKSYAVSLGGNPVGHKVKTGDGRTPEGIYKIDYKNLNSSFHLSLHISYPNKTDRKMALQNGVNPGGMIMIHGLKNGLGFIGRLHLLFDWTDGCIAVTNSEIDEIVRVTPVGTIIEIKS